MAAPAPAPQQLGANGPAWLPAPPRLYLLPHHLWWRQTRRQFLTPRGRLQVGYIRSSPQSGPARCPRSLTQFSGRGSWSRGFWRVPERLRSTRLGHAPWVHFNKGRGLDSHPQLLPNGSAPIQLRGRG